MGELLLRSAGGAPSVTVVAYGVVWMHCTRGGCYWTRVGCTLGGWGLRAVRTTLGQWIPTLVEQAYSGRLEAGPESDHDHRDPAQMAGRYDPKATVKPFEPGPCADGGQGAVGRTCDKGARLCGKNPGFTPARHGVHSTDINGPDVNVPSGDRWNPAVVLRCTAQMRL